MTLNAATNQNVERTIHAPEEYVESRDADHVKRKYLENVWRYVEGGSQGGPGGQVRENLILVSSYSASRKYGT